MATIKALSEQLAALSDRADALERRSARLVEWLWRFGNTVSADDPLGYWARAFAIEASPNLVWPLPGDPELVLTEHGGMPAEYAPVVDEYPSTFLQGHFDATPKGVILHGSRSGVLGHPTADEYLGTARWAQTNPNQYAWQATIGDDVVAVHLPSDAWGWNARAASRHYLAVEFAQSTRDAPVSDGQVRAFVWWLRQARLTYSDLPAYLPTHAEVEASGETGYRDGKDDVFPLGDPRTDDLRSRIEALLGETVTGPER